MFLRFRMSFNTAEKRLIGSYSHCSKPLGIVIASFQSWAQLPLSVDKSVVR
jgi:hypothetical protein